MTVIEGESAPVPLDELSLTLDDSVELELHVGGQPNWYWLIASQ